jgi:hypothetical protein
MSAINQAKSQLKYFVKRSAVCSIYEHSANSKVCFGKNLVIVLKLNKDRLIYKEYTFVDGQAKLAVEHKIMLNQAEMFTVKHHLKRPIKRKILRLLNT